MPKYRLTHAHDAADCEAVYASWKGIDSPLRKATALSSCPSGGHEIWWDVEADSPQSALTQLPRYVADRVVAVRVGDVEIP